MRFERHRTRVQIQPSAIFIHNIYLLIFFKKVGHPWPLFVWFRCYQTIKNRIKTVDFIGIRTRIVGVEGKNAYHLTTTTALNLFLLTKIQKRGPILDLYHIRERRSNNNTIIGIGCDKVVVVLFLKTPVACCPQFESLHLMYLYSLNIPSNCITIKRPDMSLVNLHLVQMNNRIFLIGSTNNQSWSRIELKR